VKVRVILAGLILLLTGTPLVAQIQGDVLGMHSLGPGTKSPISGARPDACNYCHAPHSGLNLGLWNQRLSKQTYTLYSSTTEANTGKQPMVGYVSSQCLSCHDGTVAVGDTVVAGQVTTTGSMTSQDVFGGGKLQTSHPFSLLLPLKDNIDLAKTVKGGSTIDPTHAVRMINGNVECTSCHNPHVQAKDMVSQNFLVKDSSNGALCLACHDPTRTSTGTGATAAVNPLADWPISAHAVSINGISTSAGLGSYSTVKKSACLSCHTPHDASGTGSRILRGLNGLDCITCHSSGTGIANMPAYANVFSEFVSSKVGHPFPSSTNKHDAAEDTLLNSNRHATCVDCHNSHASEVVGTFTAPPLLRVSQKDVAGVSATDGTTILPLAANQFENCLRCHGTSAGKQTNTIYGYSPAREIVAGDVLNIIPQFVYTATSSHPVTHTNNSPLQQPSLLPAMLNENGSVSARTMSSGVGSTQILCTDCHNSDDNREFGGTGPNGPHGSKFLHILERNYQYNSPPATPGATVGGLVPYPDLSTTAGPYAMCGKCHNLLNTGGVTTGAVAAPATDATASWPGEHAAHINAGFSCATCHTAHGMGATNASIASGERMVNFDANIVAGVGSGNAPTYARGGGGTAASCVLVCHGVTHTSTGSGTAAFRKGVGIKK